MMDNILITGASGFIGYHFQRYIDQRRIVNLDLVAPTFQSNASFVSGDIRLRHCLDEALTKTPCSSIICLAAEHKDFGIESDAYFATNEHGSRVICDAASTHGVKKIVFFSSVAVYGHNTSPSTEEMAPAPTNPYGASKHAGEQVIKQWAEANPTRAAIILRPTVVYGIRNFANMLRFIIQIDKGRYVNIGRADNVKSIAYVDNVVQATLFLMNRMKVGVEIYNYADTPQLSVAQISCIISNTLGRKAAPTLPFPLVYMAGLPFDLAIKLTGRDLPVSTARIKKICATTHHSANKLLRTGFIPQWSNVEGLQNMVSWFVKEKQCGRPPVVAAESRA